MRSLLRIRLKTYLLGLTVFAVGIAYLNAKQQRQQAQERLNRMETAHQMPRIRDITKLSIQPVSAWETRHDSKKMQWMIWVPYGERVKLRWATTGLNDPLPEKFASSTEFVGEFWHR